MANIFWAYAVNLSFYDTGLRDPNLQQPPGTSAEEGFFNELAVRRC